MAIRKLKDKKGKEIIYLDSAATSLTPSEVIDKIGSYYKDHNCNVHRGAYSLSEKTTDIYEKTRDKAAGFIGAEREETIFTSGTTESINIISRSLGRDLKEKDEIIVSVMEHHSNFVPWQQLAKYSGARFIVIGLKDGRLDKEELIKNLSEKTKVIALTHVSNVLGLVNPIKEIISTIRESKAKDAAVIIDGAQAVPHIKIDVKEIGCDFYAFSAHKMCGPTGLGILYGKRRFLERLPPAKFGGEMISTVTKEESHWADLPHKFEAGTPNISAVFGFSAAIDYISERYEEIAETDKKLKDHMIKRLQEIGAKINGPIDHERIGTVSFNLPGTIPHDVAMILDGENIALRNGHHCASPLIHELGLMPHGCLRASTYFYNTEEDIDKLIEALKKAKDILIR